MQPTHKILVNVFPKYGTHLLLNLVNSLPGHEYVGRDIDMADAGRALRVIKEMKAGEVVKAHLPWREEFAAAIEQNGIKVLSMLRDPRDAVVSLVHYLMKHKQHPLHAAYAALPDFDARLYRTIVGFEYKGQAVCRDIGSRLRDWEPWRKSGIPHLRFEDLIGEEGEGNAARQEAAVLTVVRYLGLDEQALNIPEIQSAIFDQHAHSFRSGRNGSWHDTFGERHKKAFKLSADWALLAYGYESSAGW